jgi:hypothetical protein
MSPHFHISSQLLSLSTKGSEPRGRTRQRRRYTQKQSGRIQQSATTQELGRSRKNSSGRAIPQNQVVVVVIIAATAATEQSSQSSTDDHSIETTKDANRPNPKKPNKKKKKKNEKFPEG